MDIMGIGTVQAAEDGDLGPLLERLRAVQLNADEIDWIERRLRGDPSAKMRAGPKVQDNRDRDLEIVMLDHWLQFRFGQSSAAERRNIIARSAHLSPSAVRKIVETAGTNLVRKVLVDGWKSMTLTQGPASAKSGEVPKKLRDALNPPE